ncbi:MAG TPA: hypothetical protein QGG18_00905 [Rhodospirillales bacterium]|nr:hypothetical protein [Rhodospirillales bacterium]
MIKSIGVEISPHLAKVATENAQKSGVERDISVVCADATKISLNELLKSANLDAQTVLTVVIFAYNPFSNAGLSSLLSEWACSNENIKIILFFCGDAEIDFSFPQIAEVGFATEPFAYNKNL